MEKLIPALLLWLAFTSCRKMYIDKQELPESAKTEIADSPCEEEEFVCEFPIEAEFPGGRCAWLQFLQQHLTYPEVAVNAKIEGIVVVQFKVNTDGAIFDVEAISGPNELQQNAVEVVKGSPKWIPAIINGRNIKSYKKQPIIFRLEKE